MKEAFLHVPLTEKSKPLIKDMVVLKYEKYIVEVSTILLQIQFSLLHKSLVFYCDA